MAGRFPGFDCGSSYHEKAFISVTTCGFCGLQTTLVNSRFATVAVLFFAGATTCDKFLSLGWFRFTIALQRDKSAASDGSLCV